MPSPSSPVAFSVGTLTIRWYALFILAGIIAAVLLIRWIVLRRQLDPDFLLDAAPWVVFGAIIGARFYYFLLKFGYFIHHLYQAIDIRDGGLTIHGALVGGALVVLYFCRRRKERFFTWTDMIIPGVALGQAIGRWGNWANQEAFGTPTNRFWGVAIAPAHRPPQFANYTHFQPAFLYESIFDVINCAILTYLALREPKSKTIREGDVLWTYCIVYGIGRFLIESIRTDSLYIGPLKAAYWLSMVLITIGVVGLILRRTIWPPSPITPTPTNTTEDVAPTTNPGRIDDASGEASRA